MKNKQLIVIVGVIFISFLFNIGVFIGTNVGILNDNNNLTLIVLMAISVLLSVVSAVYMTIKFKSEVYRSIGKRRFLLITMFMLILFMLINCIINKNSDLLTTLYIFIVLCLTSCIYCARLIYSRKDIVSFRHKLSKIRALIFYIKNQRCSSIILLDTPIHSNLGDSAIALAEKEYLKKVLHVNYIIEVTAEEIDNMEMIYSLFTNKNKLVLVHGGGFLGDLWPSEEKRFRRIVTSFKKNKIVVLPQTIHYNLNDKISKEFFEESKKIYATHKNLTIFAREKKSYDFLKKNYKNINVSVVPDIVTTLDIPVNNFKRKGILFCMRSDLEKIVKKEEKQQLIEVIKNKYPKEDIMHTDTVIEEMVLPKDRKEKVYLKLEEFAKSKLVITDRLHGMVFAALTNTPCIALGNSSGKVKGVYEWIKENNYIKYLDKPSELVDVLQQIDISKKYEYHVEKIEEYFKPLVEVLKEEDMYGRK